ncbi:MAG: hypothetical protein ACKPKO_04505, partial [Candidatus Fonsibacter sp.]
MQAAAAAAVYEFLGDCPAHLWASLAEWIDAHIRYGIERGVRQWQWELVVQCWGLERAGLPGVFVSDPDEADELFRQAGVHAQAARQLPFTTWRANGSPGQRATGRVA